MRSKIDKKSWFFFFDFKLVRSRNILRSLHYCIMDHQWSKRCCCRCPGRMPCGGDGRWAGSEAEKHTSWPSYPWKRLMNVSRVVVPLDACMHNANALDEPDAWWRECWMHACVSRRRSTTSSLSLAAGQRQLLAVACRRALGLVAFACTHYTVVVPVRGVQRGTSIS